MTFIKPLTVYNEVNNISEVLHLLSKTTVNRLPRPVKNVFKAGVNYYFDHLLGRGKKPPEFLLILAHMRSGSTLLCHLLMNHPAMLGSGERNGSYNSLESLEQLALVLRLERRQFFKHPDFIVDQINHTRFFNCPQLLNHRRVRPVFLIRTPAQSISSMVRTFEPIYSNWTVERAVTTYIERVNDLQALANTLERPAFFLTYSQLVTDAEQQLANLQQHLGLSSPFKTRYKTWSFTGKRGDPSPNISAGEILPQTTAELEPIPENLLQAAQSAYDDCLTTLVQVTQQQSSKN